MQSNVGIQLRVKYIRLGRVRLVRHFDSARLWELAPRRVDVPVAYTEGFTSRPKVGFCLALPTSAESLAEYVDLDLSRDARLDATEPGWIEWLGELTGSLPSVLPTGMDVVAIAERDVAEGSLQKSVTSTTWELTGWNPDDGPADDVSGKADELDILIQGVLETDEVFVERERKGQRRTDDVRPVIRDLTLRASDCGPTVVADLITIGRARRPSELAELICPGIDGTGIRVLRMHQLIDTEGERREVIPDERQSNGTNQHDRPREHVVEKRRRTARSHAGGQTQ